ncbi:hypothetical protein Q8F55_008739 [Vanrija albida]|uniref:Major facilitator superfamily (MFS) profile domain-containing protein n=1 Tax=Vanrija albida TaxID=181172 RepID=A0ABR3PRP4_9TREE
MASSPPPERLPLPPLPESQGSSFLGLGTADSTPGTPGSFTAAHLARNGQRSMLGVTSGTGRSDDPLATPVAAAPSAASRRVSNVRPSFSTTRGSIRTSRRVSRLNHHHGLDDDDDEQPKLPTLVPGIRPAYSTPLPTLPLVVLCIGMLSELLAANLSQPFMIKMVKNFLTSSGHEDDIEESAGRWTGNLVSVFYITQFFTSLLWSGIADRHGRRAVLVASMAGSAIALVMFGTSSSLPEAICVRLIQGIFGGSIGVFRGSIRDITDETNAGRAYSILGYMWGMGGVIGPILGGVFESPATNFPGTFLGRIELFERSPYLLPTLMGSSVLFIGAIMACFLSWDGGVRGGSRIQLEVEKDEPLVPSRTDTQSPTRDGGRVASLRIKPSRVFSSHEDEAGPTGQSLISTSMKLRRESLASLGTAYGYGGIRSKHPTLAARRAMQQARRASQSSARDDDEGEADPRRVSLATKFLLAADENTFNINDLWLSAAVAQETNVFDDDDDEYSEDEDASPNAIDDDEISLAQTDNGENATPMQSSPSSPGYHNRHISSSVRHGRSRVASGGSELQRALRRPSSASRRYSGSGPVPAIFANTGLSLNSTPGLAAFENADNDSTFDPFSPPGTIRRAGAPAPLAPLTAIQETRVATPASSTGTVVAEKSESRWKLLPLLVICQYGMLSCHESIHSQIFLSFILTDYKSGGVGINPAHYSILVALMCVGQLVWQFYLFPRLGPPLGRFNHLQMFRLGSALYIPGYLLVPLLHSVASPDSEGGFIVMTLMSLISALRYCGSTFAYTSIMILINAMTPPHLIGVANGLAQSVVSCARFIGPAIGGTLWGASIKDNPGGYPKGFYTVAVLAAVQLFGSLFIH